MKRLQLSSRWMFSIWTWMVTTLVAPALCVAGVHPPSTAEPSSPDQTPVPLMDNFTVAELATTGAAAAVAAAIGYWGEHIVGFPEPSIGRPAPGSVDWEVAVNLNPKPELNNEILGGIPDALGNPLLTVFGGVYYGFGAVGTWVSDADWIWDTRHEFFALAGALTGTELLVQSLKFAVGRDRPRVVRRCHPPADSCGKYGIPPGHNIEPNRQDALSFPGGHTAASSAVLSFIYLDLSDYLADHALADASDATQFWVGRILPILPTYGLIAVGSYQRLYSQSHWLSDELIGLTIGLAAGNIFYLSHFDASGAPQRDHRDRPDPSTVADSHLTPMIFSDSTIGAAWGFSW